ncbi:MAG: hypothetical protein IJ356_05865 [Erysipelotrichaceae bacterium]|nr:hypothetical protein [Erysipelotrichaceae bacterium]
MSSLFIIFLFFFFTQHLLFEIRLIFVIIICTYLLTKRQFKVLILVILMLIRILINVQMPDPCIVDGKIIKLYEQSFLMKSRYGNILVVSDDRFLVDTIVQVEGKVFKDDSSPHFFTPTKIANITIAASDIRILHQGQTLRSWIHRKSIHMEKNERELIQKILLRFSIDDSYLQSISALQILFMLGIIKKVLKCFFYEKKVDKIEAFVCCFLCYLWNQWFVCFRYFFFKFMKKRKCSLYESLGYFCLFCFLYDPALTESASFWFIVLLRLSTKIFYDKKLGFVFTMIVVSCCFYASCDLLQLFFYPLNQLISFLSFILAMLRVLFPISLNFWIYILNVLSEITVSIELHGTLSFSTLFALIMFLSALDHIRQRIVMFASIAAIALCSCNPFGRIVFFNAGQGDCTLIHFPLFFKTVLIDTGPPSSYYQLQKSLYSHSVYEIDLLILSHGDSDHSGNMEQIIKDFKVKEIWDNTMNMKTHDLLKMVQINSYDMQQDENDKSLVHMFSLNHLNYLFLGDASIEQEEVFLERISDSIDVCKIGHHGSKTSTSWKLLDKAGCRIAVISAGVNNRYNHPHVDVVERLQKNGSIILNTQYQGDIQIIMSRFFNLVTTSNHEFGIIFKE